VTAAVPIGRPRLLLALVAVALCALAAPGSSSAAACPNQEFRDLQGASYLPDCRAFELSSPVLKNGEEVETKGVVANGVPFSAAAEGSSVAYEASGGIPGTESAGLYTQYLALGGPLRQPWTNVSLNPSATLGVIEGIGPHKTGEFEYYAPDLSCGVMKTVLPIAVPTGETAEEQISNLYRWDASTNTYHLLTNSRPTSLAESQESGGTMRVTGVSADCSTVTFESDNEFNGGPSDALYKASGGAVETVSILPNGKSTNITPIQRGEQGSNINELSSDGSRVFFAAEAEPGSERQGVFMRQGGVTSEISKPQGGAAPLDTGARFQAASQDGSRVFFTANYGLTPTTSTGPEAPTTCTLSSGDGCDLYEYNVESSTLTDISVDTTDAKGANVRGVVGLTPDGSHVYFSTSGQLVPGRGRTQTENGENENPAKPRAKATNGEANVYLYAGGAPTYVTTIGATEAGHPPTVGDNQQSEVDTISSGGQGHGLKHLTARVSSSGDYLLFATRAAVSEFDGSTYDNEDQNVAGQFDFEQYEYSLASGKVTCVSCNPVRSVRPVEPAGPFAALGPFTEVRNGSQQRFLSDSGRVFFNSYAPLAAAAVNGTVNAYEWAPPGVGDCSAQNAAGCVAILDSGTDPFPTYVEAASADGSNVYITTHAQLAPQDIDGLRDVYDVRVEGGIPLPAGPSECSGEACQGPAGGGLSTSRRASETAAAGGNVAPGTGGGPGAGVGGGSVKGFTKRVVRGTSVALTVMAPSAGKITASGSGLKSKSVTVAKAATYKLKIVLTAKEIKLLKQRRKHRKGVTLKVKTAFVPTTGRASAVSSTVTFK